MSPLRRPASRTRPHLERLEDRCVPSAAVPDALGGPIRAEDLATLTGTLTNDTYVGELYALHNTGQTVGSPQGFSDPGTADADIDAAEAWDLTVGSTTVTVGVIDTGIDYTHPDLYLNVWINQEEIPPAVRARLLDLDGDGLFTFWDLNDARNQGAGKITDRNGNGRIDAGDILKTVKQGGWADGIDQDPFSTNGKSYSFKDDLVGWNFVANTNNPFDDNGHGTHVAGTIGAVGNNGVGVVGVAWKAQVAGLKFMNRLGYGDVNNAAKAVDYAVGNGMRVTNNSWGVSAYSATLYAAVSNANVHGQVFVAAAGNSGSDNGTAAVYPANFDLPNVVVVAATDNDDRLAAFSNYGSATVDLAAPGVNIASTIPGAYAFGGGTSMAAPHVTGAVVLLLAREGNLTPAQVIQRLMGTVDPLAGLAGKVATGGRLNLYRALTSTVGSPGGASGGQSGDGGGEGGPFSGSMVVIGDASDGSVVFALLAGSTPRPAAIDPGRPVQPDAPTTASDALFREGNIDEAPATDTPRSRRSAAAPDEVVAALLDVVLVELFPA